MFAQLLVSALAFNGPALRTPSSSGVEMMAKKAAPKKAVATGFAAELGAQPPLGFIDPLNLLDGADQERFDRLRFVEIKHGRICMLAVLGHIVTAAGIRLPGDIAYGIPFADMPAGLEALSVVPAGGLLQIVLFVGALELFVMKDIPGTGNEFVGDFRNGYIDFGWDTLSADAKLQKRAIELNNGRAAQMGILALMVHEKLDNDPYIINSLLGAPVPFNP